MKGGDEGRWWAEVVEESKSWDSNKWEYGDVTEGKARPHTHIYKHTHTHIYMLSYRCWGGLRLVLPSLSGTPHPHSLIYSFYNILIHSLNFKHFTLFNFISSSIYFNSQWQIKWLCVRTYRYLAGTRTSSMMTWRVGCTFHPIFLK